MNASFWLALVLALSVGLSIGLQATLINRTGQEIGAVRPSLLINMAAGTLAGLVLLSFGVRLVAGGSAAYQLSLSRPVLLVTLFVGLLSIITVTGFAYSLQLIGVSATLQPSSWVRCLSAHLPIRSAGRAASQYRSPGHG